MTTHTQLDRVKLMLSEGHGDRKIAETLDVTRHQARGLIREAELSGAGKLAPHDVPVDLCRASPTARPVQKIKVEILARSIGEIGLRQPINVREIDGFYEVRGGGHRLAAFVQLGRPTIPAFIRQEDDLRAELAEIDENYARNDLSEIQRDLAIARRKEIYELLHPETVHGAAGKGRPKSRQVGDSKQPPAARFTKDTAQSTGVGERTVQRSVARVETIGAETMAKLDDTSLSTGVELDALVQLSPEKREEVVQRALTGDEKVSAKLELQRERRDNREETLGKEIAALPARRFGLIYCDIPRHFNVRSDETGLGRSPENHYPTMSFEETLALPVHSIAADDCILIFWSTAASLMDDLEIMAEWGFVSFRPRDGRGKLSRPNGQALPAVGPGAYKSMQVWDKVNIGLGYWFRDRHEFILIGTRGNVVPPSPGTQAHSLFTEEKSEHSAKPARVAEMIEKLWPTLPKVELFCRGPARDGWDAWGNQAEAARAPAEIPHSGLAPVDVTQFGNDTPEPLLTDDAVGSPSALVKQEGGTEQFAENASCPVADPFPDIPTFLRRPLDPKPAEQVK
jgi:N6-adenosine-specific RNA methylase IME4